MGLKIVLIKFRDMFTTPTHIFPLLYHRVIYLPTLYLYVTLSCRYLFWQCTR
jgi:hypothetical protein